MNTSRAEILKMVESGDLSPAEAAARLAPKPAPATIPLGIVTTTAEGKARWLHVRVMNLNTGNAKVTVNVPMSWVRAGLAIGARFTPQLDGLDWRSIEEALSSNTEGQIIEVEDLEKGERVQIYTD